MTTISRRSEQHGQKESNLFAGILFVLAGFDRQAQIQFGTALEEDGALNVGRYDASCTHVIVSQLLYDDPVCAAARKDGKALVTEIWVADCLDLGVLLDTNNVLYKPLLESGGIPGCKGLVICLTGYQGQARRDVMRMVEMMGAQFTKPFIAATVTHLICYRFEGDKYCLAKQLGVKLVNHQWLEDCLKEWALLPEESYSKSGWELELSQATVNDSENGNNKEIHDPVIVADQSFACSGHPKAFENMVMHASTQAAHSPYDSHFDKSISSCNKSKEMVNDNTLIGGSRCMMKHERQGNENSTINENLLLSLKDKIEDPIYQLRKVNEDAVRGNRTDSNILHLSGGYLNTEEQCQLEQHRQENLQTPVSCKKQICCAELKADGQSIFNNGACTVDTSKVVASTPVKRKVNQGEVEKESQGIKLGVASVHKLKSTDNTGDNCRQINLNMTTSILHPEMDHGNKSAGSTRRKKSGVSKIEGVMHELGQEGTIELSSAIKPIFHQLPEFATDGELASKEQNMLNCPDTKTSNRHETNINRKCRVLYSDIHETKSTEKEDHEMDQTYELDLDVTLNKTVQNGNKVCLIKIDGLENDADTYGRHGIQKGNVFPNNHQQGKPCCLKQICTDLSENHQRLETISKGNMKCNHHDDGNLITHECFSTSEKLNLKKQCYGFGKTNSENMKTISKTEVTMQKKKSLSNANGTELIKQACESIAEASFSSKKAVGFISKLNFENAIPKSEELNGSKINSFSIDCHYKAASVPRKRRNQFDSKENQIANKENCFAADKQAALVASNSLPRENDAYLIAELTRAESGSVLLSDNRISDRTEEHATVQTKSKDMVFALSGDKHGRKTSQQIIKKLGARICRDSHHWCHQTTHLVVPDAVRRTEKVFAAAAAGRWILKADYLQASLKAGRFLNEEAFELQGPGMNDDASISLEAARKWRLLFNSTGCGAFHGLRVVVYGECRMPPLDTLKRAIKAGGGNILATVPPYTRCLSSGIDFAIVNSETPQEDEWIQKFLNQKVACVTKDYFVDFVCKPSVSLDMYILYGTNYTVSKALERLECNIKGTAEQLSDYNNAGTEAINSIDDIACCKCGKKDREDVMLLCGDGKGNGCGVAVHINCCNPPLKEVPVDDWFCGDCTKPPALRKTKRQKKQMKTTI